METIIERIQYWSEQIGESPALVADGRAHLTYRGFADFLDRFRRDLNGWGYGRGDRIAIVHSGGTEMAATVVGVMGPRLLFRSTQPLRSVNSQSV